MVRLGMLIPVGSDGIGTWSLSSKSFMIVLSLPIPNRSLSPSLLSAPAPAPPAAGQGQGTAQAAVATPGSKGNDTLFGPNIGVLGGGPEWTESMEKSADVHTPEIVKGWIAKSKEVSDSVLSGLWERSLVGAPNVPHNYCGLCCMSDYAVVCSSFHESGWNNSVHAPLCYAA